MELSKRQRAVLREVIESYIRTGEAVASRQVAVRPSLNLSPATIRSVLAELEECGYVVRSHSSAGAIPTDQSFRLYVDELCGPRRLPAHARRALADRITCVRRELVEDIAWVAQLISEMTREAGVAVHPLGQEVTLEAVSLIPLTGNRLLGVVVSSGGMIEKRAFSLTGEWSGDDLQVLSNYITATFRGRPLSAIRRELEEAPGESDTSIQPLTGRFRSWATTVVEELFELSSDSPDVKVAGADQLLETSDFAEVDRLRSLLTILGDRGKIAEEWSREAKSGCRTRFIIGNESDVTAQGNLGMVATYFYHQGRRRGAIGVLGPRRMDYGRIVPVVEFIGDTLTRMLEEGGSDHA
ncbi:MAG: heat-inducible transcription repressor HrcA [bacterium]|nr:heat-inducible transcription repressor HrcA [bacterium]